MVGTASTAIVASAAASSMRFTKDLLEFEPEPGTSNKVSRRLRA